MFNVFSDSGVEPTVAHGFALMLGKREHALSSEAFEP
jgi:hypothetical protein